MRELVSKDISVGRTQRSNHSSAFNHPEIISESIQTELRKRRISQISDLPSNYFYSPIDLTPKYTNDIQTGWRVIFDLSSSQDSSINAGILKEYDALVYETLNDAVQLIIQTRKEAMMMKRDLKATFRHIPINPCDY